MRWLAIRFSRLPLEVLALDPGAASRPWAVVEHRAEGACLVMVNAPAAAGGAQPGLSPAAARALLPGLGLVTRDRQREHRVLEGLASWALQFSSQVCVFHPDTLLVEVAGSRRLFGGETGLTRAVRRAVGALAYEAGLVLAPTPRGALLLARDGRQERVADVAALKRSLAAVSVRALPLPREKLAALESAGLRHCGDLLVLPRDALGRRLGAGFLDWWARLLGEAPDPLPLFRPPEHFHQEVELPMAVQSVEALLFPARRLLLMLEGFLRARQVVVARLGWVLVHQDLPSTGMTLGFQAPLRDAMAMLSLLKERMSRLALAAPVMRLVLRADELLMHEGKTASLLRDGEGARDDGFLDRLRARLGTQAVSGLCVAADHRPEYSMRRCAPGTRGPQLRFPERPQWLLDTPRVLEVRDGRPWWRGPLVLEGERERIDAGWWDERPVRRDYFTARAASGTRLWVFIDPEQGNRWFLHGFFG